MSVRVDVVERYSVTLDPAAEREYRRLAQTDESEAEGYAVDYAFARENDAYHDIETEIDTDAPGRAGNTAGVAPVPSRAELDAHAERARRPETEPPTKEDR